MKRILIIGNYIFGRKYMEHSKRLGYEVILATAIAEEELSTIEKSNIDYYIQIDYFQEEESLKKITDFSIKIPFDGVLAGHVFLPNLVNLVSKRLNLPFFGTDAIENTTSKEKTRERMKKMGMFEATFFKFSSINEILQQKESLNYPCIVKPLNGFGSINVEKVNSLDDLLTSFNKNASNLNYGILGSIFSKQILVEPYIDGKEFSVESIVEKGKVNSIMITEKVFNEKFENVENGHIMPTVSLDDLEEKQIISYVNEIHKVFDINTGITHTEIKVNQDGIHLIELNPRVGGGFIAEMLSQVLNVDFYKIIIENCIGEKCDQVFKKSGYGYIRFIHSPKAGRFLGFKNIGDLIKDKNFLDMEYKIEPNSLVEKLDDNRGRLALFAYFSSESFESVEKSALLLQQNARIIMKDDTYA
ncbi:ATP-grasp domain-containing protein [Listeria marthii]|uniref:ATP-grasp domain-containing protein n=1 Tax=Listeria marthii TaxID=529731 RepID=UPI0016247737|nr:ATP-grasp domain-containing protein [Listeria marthii]MBC1970820.1 ATP-grasp domain-containing protein [Listeria marthii]MBC2086379.1 ATP-grasp domain-containing protein [Listeria marthii]MBF2490579.1 ATP-grasp domain-containing protein [Listeria marthii]MBF2676013.1 ATP-grasp domain-containing protein [Listeria marthii]